MNDNRPRNKVDDTWAYIGSNELNLSKLIKCILLDNPFYLKVFCHALLAMQGYWRIHVFLQNILRKFFVLKSASFFDIDCDFRFQHMLLSFYNLAAPTS